MLQRVSLPHPLPAPLVYTVNAGPQELRFYNAFTGIAVTPTEGTPPVSR